MTKDERFLELLRDRLGAEHVIDARQVVAQRYGKVVHLPRPAGSVASLFGFHHTDSAERVGLEGALQSTWDYHIRRLEWKTGGYAIAVDFNGDVFILASPFAHMTYGAGERWNPICAFVVAIGNFHGPTGWDPSPAMLQAIYSVGLSLDDASGAEGGRPWRPHSAIRQTVCPGDHMVDHIWRMTSSEYGAKSPRPEHYP